MSTCEQTVSLGAYVLGALEPAERAEFERHLAGCAVCQAELLRLAPLTGLLHQVAPEDFADDPETDESIEPPLPMAPAPRRPRRYLLVAAAAVLAVLIGVGAVLGYRALTGPEVRTADPSVTWTGRDVTTGAHAAAQLINRTWGTEVRLMLDDLPTGKPCKLVVRGRQGNREVAGWWSAQYRPDEVIPGSTSVGVGDIDRLQVVTDDDTVLVDIPAPH